MIRFFNSGITVEIKTDWLGFSVRDYDFKGFTPKFSDSIFDLLPPMKKIPGRFHFDRYTGPGVVINHRKKPGSKNEDLEIELSGQYLSDRGAEPLIEYLLLSGAQIRLFRIDACLDYFGPVEQRKPTIKGGRGQFKQFYDQKDEWTGFKYGVSDRVVRLYDKGKESKSGKVHWRYEIALRGDKARAAISEDFSRVNARQIDLACANILSTTGSCYDDFFRDLAGLCQTGEVVFKSVKKGEYTMAERILFDEIETRVKRFEKRWRKEIKEKYGSVPGFYHTLIVRLEQDLLNAEKMKQGKLSQG